MIKIITNKINARAYTTNAQLREKYTLKQFHTQNMPSTIQKQEETNRKKQENLFCAEKKQKENLEPL